MTDATAGLTDDQVVTAASLVGQFFLEVGLTSGGQTSAAAQAEIHRLSKQFSDSKFSWGSPTQSAGFVTELRSVLNQLAAAPGRIGTTVNRAIEIAANGANAAGWGAEAATVIIAIGFSTALLVLVANTSFSFTFKQGTVAKNPGFPKEVVQVVTTLAENAAKTLPKL